MQLTVSNIKVRSLSVEFNEVSWEVAPTAEDLLDYTFQVLRSEAAEGPWSELTPTLTDQFIFVDNIIKSKNRYRQYFYKVQVTNKLTDDTKIFGPASRGPETELVTLAMRHDMNLLFKEFAGRRCWILPVRTFGQRCDCFNETLKRRTRSGCRTCYDKGFVRGYMHPIEMWMQFDPNPKNEQPTNVGKQQQSNTTARMGYWPPVKPGDVIIEPENKRWKVIHVSTTQHNRSAVQHELQLHEVPEDDVLYLIELVLDKALRDTYFSPPRNFTNPQGLQNFEAGNFDAIAELYGGCK